jgi:hypothetical protein
MDIIAPKRKVGLAVMDGQLLHAGHVAMLAYMERRLAEGVRIVALGSVGQHGKPGHPFTFEQRMAMIRAVFGQDTFKFVPLQDIDATSDNDDWLDYVVARVQSNRLPSPTDYFSGSQIDAGWYANGFSSIDGTSELLEIESTGAVVHTDKGTGRAIHIVDRHASEIPSGREVRTLVERRSPEWRKWVSPVLHDYVEWNYPPHLRLPLRGGLPPEGACPVGTRYVAGSGSRTPDTPVLELKDDGKWRPVAGPDEKTRHAMAARAGAKIED